jgi:hypothetical protein
MLAAILRSIAGDDPSAPVIPQFRSAHADDLIEALSRQEQKFQWRGELRALGLGRLPELYDLGVLKNTVARSRYIWSSNSCARIDAHPALIHQPREHFRQRGVHCPCPRLAWSFSAPLEPWNATFPHLIQDAEDVVAVDLGDRPVAPTVREALGNRY